jgi:hypothetical protein
MEVMRGISWGRHVLHFKSVLTVSAGGRGMQLSLLMLLLLLLLLFLPLGCVLGLRLRI